MGGEAKRAFWEVRAKKNGMGDQNEKTFARKDEVTVSMGCD